MYQQAMGQLKGQPPVKEANEEQLGVEKLTQNFRMKQAEELKKNIERAPQQSMVDPEDDPMQDHEEKQDMACGDDQPQTYFADEPEQ